MVEYLDGGRIQGTTIERTGASAETLYDNTSTNSGASMSNGGTYYAYGNEFQSTCADIGKTFNKWSITWQRNNSPQGVVEAQIYTGTEGSTSKTWSQTSTNSQTVDSTSTSNTSYAFTFANSHTISAGDVVVLVWKTDTSTSGSNYINIRLNSSLIETGVRTYFITTANWDSGKDHTWSVAPSPYTTYGLTSKLEQTAVSGIDNVPTGTRFEETNTRKIYRYDSAVTLQEGGWSGTLDDAITLYSYQGGGKSGVYVQINSGSALEGMNVSRVGLQIIKHSNVGSTSYPACVGVWDTSNIPDYSASDKGAKHVFAEFNLRDLSQGYTDEPSFGVDGDHDTGCDGEYTLQAGDYLGVSVHQGSGATVIAQVKASYDGDKFDGANTQIGFHQGAQSSFTNMADGGEDDMYIKIYGKAGWVERGTAV